MSDAVYTHCCDSGIVQMTICLFFRLFFNVPKCCDWVRFTGVSVKRRSNIFQHGQLDSI